MYDLEGRSRAERIIYLELREEAAFVSQQKALVDVVTSRVISKSLDKFY